MVDYSEFTVFSNIAYVHMYVCMYPTMEPVSLTYATWLMYAQFFL